MLGKGSVYISSPEVQQLENNVVKLHCTYSGFSSLLWSGSLTVGTPLGSFATITRSLLPMWTMLPFQPTAIAFSSVIREHMGTCIVTEDNGNSYREVHIQLTVFVSPSKPTVNIPSSATIGTQMVLTCSEQDVSPPSEYSWFRDKVLMLEEPKNTRAFINSSYTLDHKTGELIFSPLTTADSGEYTCQAQNGFGTPMKSDSISMKAVELNVGGIVSAVFITLILLGVLIFSIWFAYSGGYFETSSGKKVIYSQPTAWSEGEFKQTLSFLV
ncbi:Junctional adhesion molecule A [Heterocephalus glaber]|uniref:Junctional adhesion molecule A n=1 Tax=Heterocephalus glaber TaxID=10181 RepID=G5BX22_HETGA|nr:Junctional adhesion molecule A [Heterocephalus glaber]